MKKVFALSIVFCVIVSACSFIKEIKPANNVKMRVVVTISPLYDFAKYIGGEYVDVYVLLSSEDEIYHFEPKPSDIQKIKIADVFIYTGDFLEPWAKNILDSANETGLTVIDSSVDIFIEENDPYIWLDSENAQIMVDNIASGFIEADPLNKDYYSAKAFELETRLANSNNNHEIFND